MMKNELMIDYNELDEILWYDNKTDENGLFDFINIFNIILN